MIFETNLENRGLDQKADAKSFRWVHDISGNEEMIYFADAGIIVFWVGTEFDSDRDAEIVLGQENFEKNGEFPYIKQGASRLRFPYSLSVDKDLIAVADTANNRVLFWSELPKTVFINLLILSLDSLALMKTAKIVGKWLTAIRFVGFMEFIFITTNWRLPIREIIV